MIVRPGELGALQPAREERVPNTLSNDTHFKDIMKMMQQDGIIAADVPVRAGALTDAQKTQLREAFNINDMAAFSQKRALLNELVGLGLLSAEESELSGMQLLPPALGSGVGAPLVAGVDEMLDEPNYLAHLEKAVQLDELWGPSTDVRNARSKLYEILTGIFA